MVRKKKDGRVVVYDICGYDYHILLKEHEKRINKKQRDIDFIRSTYVYQSKKDKNGGN